MYRGKMQRERGRRAPLKLSAVFRSSLLYFVPVSPVVIRNAHDNVRVGNLITVFFSPFGHSLRGNIEPHRFGFVHTAVSSHRSGGNEEVARGSNSTIHRNRSTTGSPRAASSCTTPQHTHPTPTFSRMHSQHERTHSRNKSQIFEPFRYKGKQKSNTTCIKKTPQDS